MTPSARLSALIEILALCCAKQAPPADVVLAGYTRQRRYIGSKDRRALSSSLFSLYRNFGMCLWALGEGGIEFDTLPENNQARMVVLADLVINQKYPIDHVKTLFNGEKFAPDILTAREENLLVSMSKYDTSQAPKSAQLNVPEAVYQKLGDQWGEAKTEAELRALQKPALLDLRVNTLKAARESVLTQLTQEEITASATPWSPWGIRVAERPAFSVHTLYKKGAFDIQDEGSQMLSLLSGVRPGQWVCDFCAGAGGKTLGLGALMQNKGRIYACDTDARRLHNGRKRYARAGLDTVELHQFNGDHDPWIKRHTGKCDVVLIDAPCGGSGTWRRSPFALWQFHRASENLYPEIQAEILQTASQLVKKGGVLVYATCSLFAEENQNQIENFLSTEVGQQFTLDPLINAWPEGLGKPPPWLDPQAAIQQLTPAQHDTDGFFIARMKKA